MPEVTLQGKKLSTVELNWKEVFYTNCGMVSASNVDQELTWCRTDFAAIGVEYAHLLSRRENDWYPDWRLQANNEPAVITCSDVMAEQHPELVVTFLKAMIKVGRWANEHKHAAAVILDRQTYYRDVEDTYQCIKHIDMVPSLSPKNLAQIGIGKDFMLEHGYIQRDFDVHEWAAPEFLEQAGRELIEERWEKATAAKLPGATVIRTG